MKKNRGKLKLNDKGATLVAVLMAVAFIAILGSISIVGAMVNLKMKVVDRQAQKTFYSCEEAVDEMYVRLGEVSMRSLDVAYNEIMDTMVRSFREGDPDDPYWLSYTISDEEVPGTNGLTRADLELRERYMDKVVSNLGIGTFNGNNLRGQLDAGKLRTLLNSYIGVNDTTTNFWDEAAKGNIRYPYVDSMGDCSYYRDYTDVSVYVLVAKDVRVRYVRDNGFQSDLVFDIGIKLPISDINLNGEQSSINKVPSMGKFSLISDTQIFLGGNDACTIDGNVYAGAQGIIADENSKYTYVGEYMITSGDLELHRQSSTIISGTSDIWCENIKIPKNYPNNLGGLTTNYGVSLSLNGGAYVANDLNASAASSKISVGGHYFGYENQGMSGDNSLGEARDKSSAIIINGAHSDLTLKTSYIYLAGRSYLVYDSTTNEPYRTGESLSFKGDQEAYLVPPSAINSAAGANVGNPVSGDFAFNATMQGNLAAFLTTEFFGKSLLSATSPYIVKSVPSDISGHSNDMYYYLNFKDAASSATYMKMVLEAEDKFRIDCAALGITGASFEKALTQKNYMLSLIKVNLKDLDQQTSGFVAPVGTVVTSGVLVEAEINGSTTTMNNSISLSPDTYVTITADLENRYRMLKDILDMPNNFSVGGSSFANWGTYSTGPFTSTMSGRTITYPEALNSNSGTTPGTRIVSRSGVENFINKHGSTNVIGDGDYRIVISNGGYTFNSSSGFKGGIIVSRGGRIQINDDFDGLAIGITQGGSGGNIVVNNSSVVNTINASEVIDSICRKLTDSGQDELASDVLAVFGGQLLTAGGSSGSGSIDSKIEISSVSYSQLVYFDNWKKTDLTNTSGVLPAPVTP